MTGNACSITPAICRRLVIRLQRATDDPGRDRNKWREIAPHLRDLEAAGQVLEGPDYRELLTEYRWMIEEFKVSVFAQKLKTAQPVSQKKLKQKWAEMRRFDFATALRQTKIGLRRELPT